MKHVSLLSLSVPPSIRAFEFGTVTSGMRARVSCLVALGDLPLKLQWYKNGRALTNIEPYDVAMNDAPVHHSSTKNTQGSTKTSAYDVHKNLIQSTDYKPYVRFNSSASKTELKNFTRSRRHTDNSMKIGNNQPTTGITITQPDHFTSSLVLSNVTRGHAGNYTCIASNSVREASHSAILHVHGIYFLICVFAQFYLWHIKE